MRRHLLDLILFSTYAELRAERSRSYLGLIWWVLEPAMMMLVFYLVFGVILHSGGPDYVPFLLIGFTIWQWIKSCITHAGYAIWSNLPLIRQAPLPPLMFALVQMLADTVKFFFIFALLVVVLWFMGFPPNITYFALIPLFVIVFVFSIGAGFVVAAVVPLIPDLRFVIEQFLTILMFLSGVIFSLDAVPADLAQFLKWNPILELIEATRGILMHARWPDLMTMIRVAIESLAICALGISMVQRLSPRYPKLAA